MSEELNQIVLDGNTYISVKRAAELTKYTPDYIGQLCRGGKIDATRIGRNWYVREGSLLEHKGQYTVREAPPEAEEQSEVPPLVRTKQHTAGQSIFKNGFIVYYTDDSPLLPALDVRLASENEPEKEEVIIGPSEEPLPKEAVINVPEADIVEERMPNMFERIRLAAGLRKGALAAAFVLVFAVLFSLNGGYTASLIADTVTNVAAYAGDTKFGRTVGEEIVGPFEYAAYELHDTIDRAVYDFLYEGVVYEK